MIIKAWTILNYNGEPHIVRQLSRDEVELSAWPHHISTLAVANIVLTKETDFKVPVKELEECEVLLEW